MSAEGWRALKGALEQRIAALESENARLRTEAPSPASSSADAETQTAADDTAELRKELERLRRHIMDTEDAHTQQLLECDRRETELRAELAQKAPLEAALPALSARCEEWAAYAAARDGECARLGTALANLQGLLEQLQAEQDAAVARETRPLRAELAKAREEAAAACVRADRAAELEQSVCALERSLGALRRELGEREAALAALRAETEPLRETLQRMGAQLESMTRAEESAVDKRLVRKLFVTFFARPAQRHELLELMARILDFSEEEKEVLGLAHAPIPPSPSNKLKAAAQKPLSQLWVEFLLRESGEMHASVPRKT